jgi:hypothetical protein
MTFTARTNAFESPDIKTLFYNIILETGFPAFTELLLIELNNELLNINH